MYKVRLETKDLVLGKAKMSDAEALLENYWKEETTARYMLHVPLKTIEEAREKLKLVIEFQKDHMAYLVYEKATMQPIGMAAMKEIAPGVYEDGGVGMGEKFVGKGYGKQILNCFFDYLFSEMNAQKIICSCHPENIPSKKLQQSCGMKYTHSEEFTRKKDNVTYMAEYYEITVEDWKQLKEKVAENTK